MSDEERDYAQGAYDESGGIRRFRVWAPNAESLDLVIAGGSVVPMEPDHGFFEAEVSAPPGTRYAYRIDGMDVPDPASRYQPEGVHAFSEIVDSRFAWSDGAWKGIALRDAVFYELHVGTFSKEGTFDGVIEQLGRLRALGVTLIELMPVAQFPGGRNWGYDGVLPYAVQSSYGGPAGLKRLVDAAHREGLGVCLDVVYNHFGPEGNYLDKFGPYFTDRYVTPWGRAINFDGPDSDPVREYFIANALMWIDEFHIDALRLDAVHAIYDNSAYSFLQELGDRVHARARDLGREVLIVPESDRNDPRIVRPVSAGGLGLDAHWSDDFHHALHTLLTEESAGYYEDFGRVSDLLAVYRSGYAYAMRYSRHRRRRHGADADDIDGMHLVVAAQNHDQVGNRMNGERLAVLVGFEQIKLAAAATLLSPFLPLLFMGEEYGEPAPFLYFVSHGDADLIAAVRKGRREEFASFSWHGEPPDPQAEETFEKSRIDPALAETEPHAWILELHRELLGLRRTIPALGPGSAGSTTGLADEEGRTLVLRRTEGSSSAILALNFADRVREVRAGGGRWRKVVDTAEARWGGPGSPAAATLESLEAGAISLAPHAAVAWIEDSATR